MACRIPQQTDGHVRNLVIVTFASFHHPSVSALALALSSPSPLAARSIKVTFKNAKGEVMKTVEANEGDDIVDLSWEHDLDIEGGSTSMGEGRGEARPGGAAR